MDSEKVSREQAEMWEIGENLHSAELTVVQRSEQVARWTELAGVVSRQVAAKGRPESGNRKAARELNIPEKEVRRAVKIASLTPEAKTVAAERGLDDNQSALLEAAKVEPARQADYPLCDPFGRPSELLLAYKRIKRVQKGLQRRLLILLYPFVEEDRC